VYVIRHSEHSTLIIASSVTIDAAAAQHRATTSTGVSTLQKYMRALVGREGA